jgi:aminoglycoside/choline kinase family phosphotransferase
LLAEPACDGMDLLPALRTIWGDELADVTLHKLRGDASTRSYYRLRHPARDPASVIVMRLPADTAQLQSGAGELPFVNMHRHLSALGLPVPRIHVDDTPRGVLLLEDLSDETFEARLVSRAPAAWPELYGHALDLLVRMHERATPAVDGCIAYTRSFTRPLLRWELEHFRDWGLDALDLALSPGERSELDASCDRLADEIVALPQGFAHRDYQSRNLMWSPRGELVLIDFQDALQGPAVYDLVALLCDSYVELDEPLQRSLMARYAHARGISTESLEHAFWLVAAQRKLKDAGRFVFIDQVRGNPSFLPWYAPSLAYAGRALSHLPGYASLYAILRRAVRGFPERVAQPGARTGTRVLRAADHPPQ